MSVSTSPHAANELDLRGLKCPLPVLLTRKALRRMENGDRLVIACTDPLAGVDIPHLVRQDGHTLEAHHVSDGVAIFRVLKRSHG